jgi:hypothetical protein
MISFPCSSCFHPVTVPDDYVDQWIDCPQCGLMMVTPVEVVPSEVDPSPPAQEERHATVSTLMGIGIALLLYLGCVPLFPVGRATAVVKRTDHESVKGPFKIPSLYSQSWQAKAMLFTSLLICLSILVSLCLYGTVKPRTSDELFSVTGAIACGWGVLMAFWLGGLVWKGREELPPELHLGINMTVTATTGIGMFLGVAAAGAVMVVFGLALKLHGRTHWALMAEVIGLFLGLAIFLACLAPTPIVRE